MRFFYGTYMDDTMSLTYFVPDTLQALMYYTRQENILTVLGMDAVLRGA